MRKRKYSWSNYQPKVVSLAPPDASYPKYIMRALLELQRLVLAAYPGAEIEVLEGIIYEDFGFHMTVTADADWDEMVNYHQPYNERLGEMNVDEPQLRDTKSNLRFP